MMVLLRRACLTACFVAASACADGLPDPKEMGPYPVGVTTIVLVDHSRQDPATNGPRTLPTEIWYPAADDERELPKNRLRDFLLRGQAPTILLAFRTAFKVKIEDLDKQFQNDAVRDARMREGKFPLIVFSHGNGGVRFQSTFWCDHMASHGYVVVSPDHTGNSAATIVNGKIVVANGKSREQHAKDRPIDVSFLIDAATRWSKGEDSRFAGRIDLEKIGVAGHSFGGYTSGAVINTDKRVKAIIPMTPVFGPRTNYDVPLCLLMAAEDATIKAAGNANALKYFEETKADKVLVNVKDAGHFSFSDMFQFRPDFGDGVGTGKRITKPEEPITYIPMDEVYRIANSYSVAFFGVYLKGEGDYAGFLASNQFPEEIEHRFEKAAKKETASAE
jgi:predicted dienelactone hydrolase